MTAPRRRTGPAPRTAWRAAPRLLAALLALGAAACHEPTAPAVATTPATRDLVPLPTAVPPGLGGSYTLNVSGPYVEERVPSPTGITLFPGIPIEVNVSGQVTRTMTEGFQTFCGIFTDACPDFVLSNAPFGPGGLADTGLGAAILWWDVFFGWYYQVQPFTTLQYFGPSGTRLLAGRTGLYCSWGYVDDQGNVTEGDCYSMGGGFTWTAHVAATPPGAAGLTLDVVKNGLGPTGGPVDLKATVTDGSPASNLQWYFVADAITSETDPPVPGASLSRAATTRGRLAPSARTSSLAAEGPVRRRVKAINARTRDTTVTDDPSTLPAGAYLFVGVDSAGTAMDSPGADAMSAPGATAMRMAPSLPAASRTSRTPGARSIGSATPLTGALPAPITGSAKLDGCAGSLTCSVNLQVPGGTFVVTGVVHGALRAAERRVAAAAVKSCKVEVTPFGQGVGDWASEQYDHINKTIQQRGCAMTSLAMALSPLLPTPLDPGHFNEILNATPGGYTKSGAVSWATAVDAVSAGGARYQPVSSTADMKAQICAGNPVVVGVKLDADGVPHHFVLVTEVLDDGTFIVTDPGHGSGETGKLSDFAGGYSLRGTVKPVAPRPSPSRSAVFSPQLSRQVVGGLDDVGPPEVTSDAFLLASNAAIDVSAADGSHTTADATRTTVGIPGSAAFIDAVDDDDAPFEPDASPQPSVALRLDGRSYTAVMTPVTSGAVTIQFATSTPSGTTAPRLFSTTATAGVPLVLDLVASADGGMQAMGSATGFVTINRSCGATHTVTNANGLPLSLTWAIEGSTEHGTLELPARPADAAASVTVLTTSSRSRILLYNAGRLVYRAEVPPGCS